MMDQEMRADELGRYPQGMDRGALAAEFGRRAALADRPLFGADMKNMAQTLLTESEWRRIRRTLKLFGERGTCPSGKSGEQLLFSLRPLLLHSNKTVQRTAAETAARLILKSEDSESLWKTFLHSLLFPGNGSEAEGTGSFLPCFLKEAEEVGRHDLLHAYESYFKSARWDRTACLFLLEGLMGTSPLSFSFLERHEIFGFIRFFLAGEDEELRLNGLYLLLLWLRKGWKPLGDEARFLAALKEEAGDPPCIRYLKDRIGREPAVNGLLKEAAGRQKDDSSEAETGDQRPPLPDNAGLMKDNIALDADRISILVRMEMLRGRVPGLAGSLKEAGEPLELERYADHLYNVLWLSRQPQVFLKAGAYLEEIFPFLSQEKRQELFRDVLKQVEIIVDSSSYIPYFLGRTWRHLKEEDKRENAERLRTLSFYRSVPVAVTAVETVCVILREELSQSSAEKFRKGKLFRELTGTLYGGLFHYLPQIAEESAFQAGLLLFDGSGRDGNFLYELAGKLLTARAKADPEGLPERLILSRIASELERFSGPLAADHASPAAEVSASGSGAPVAFVLPADGFRPEKVAFFSGVFDPFSRADCAIAKELEEQGFEVAVNVSDFVWQEDLLPLPVRRQLAAMSLAGLPHSYLLPEEIAINPANEADLKHLKEMFAGRPVYLAVRSREIEGNEEYFRGDGEYAPGSFPHILITGSDETAGIRELRRLIRAETLVLQLPACFAEEGGEEIRGRIREGREIASLTEPLAALMIREKKLYPGRPEKKLKEQEEETLPGSDLSGEEKAVWFSGDGSNGEPSAYLSWRECGPQDLYEIFHDRQLANTLRERLSGRMAVAEVFRFGSDPAAGERLFAEFLTLCQEKEIAYAMIKRREEIDDLLLSSGFLPVPEAPSLALVDMRHPIVLFQDTISRLKEPFRSAVKIREEVRQGSLRLKRAVSHLFPGSLVLNFPTEDLSFRLTRLIADWNRQEKEKTGEELLAVPFGKILKRTAIPETAAKEMYSEKLYRDDLSSFDIVETPGYPSLKEQIRVLRSFGKPVLLTDDLFHKGFRMEKVGSAMREEGVSAGRLAVGLLSGAGQDLARERGLEVRSVFRVPGMKLWLMESDLYPFVGGDGCRTAYPSADLPELLPSVNGILPYQYPSYLKTSTAGAVVLLSETAMENARSLWLALEECSEELTGRRLDFKRIGEVLEEPRYPADLAADAVKNERVSGLICREGQKLKRLSAFAGAGRG